MVYNLIFRTVFIERYLQSPQHNVHSKPSVYCCVSAAIYCPAIPHTVPIPPLRLFVSICIAETGTVMDWLLWHVAVLLISKRTAVI